MNWDADFAGLPPIDLPDGRRLETLGECAAYILELPKREQERAMRFSLPTEARPGNK
jgi:hypothetical protein